jgi:hypothetical protein
MDAFLTAARSHHPQHAPPAAWCLAQLLTDLGRDGVVPLLLAWVAASDHAEVAPLAKAAFARLQDKF